MKILISINQHVLLVDCEFAIDGDIDIAGIYLAADGGLGKMRRLEMTGKPLDRVVSEARKEYMKAIKEY